MPTPVASEALGLVSRGIVWWRRGIKRRVEFDELAISNEQPGDKILRRAGDNERSYAHADRPASAAARDAPRNRAKRPRGSVDRR